MEEYKMDNELNIANNDIIEEESISSKIKGAQDQINQMERMIEENHRMIDLGDDVEGRTKMISHLENLTHQLVH